MFIFIPSFNHYKNIIQDKLYFLKKYVIITNTFRGDIVEKKHISDFSMQELEIINNFVDQFNTVGGIKYNLTVLMLDKMYRETQQNGDLGLLDDMYYTDKFYPFSLSSYEKTVLRNNNIKSLDELAEFNLDEITLLPGIKERLKAIIRIYKMGKNDTENRKNDINGKAK